MQNYYESYEKSCYKEERKGIRSESKRIRSRRKAKEDSIVSKAAENID